MKAVPINTDAKDAVLRWHSALLINMTIARNAGTKRKREIVMRFDETEELNFENKKKVHAKRPDRGGDRTLGRIYDQIDENRKKRRYITYERKLKADGNI